MSYINRKNSAIISTKLTAKGRESIATGNLDWSFWSIGDSEVDYDNIDNILPSGEGLAIIKPKDINPHIQSYLEMGDCEITNALNFSNKKVEKCVVSSPAKERGFFSGDTYELKLNTPFTKDYGTINLSALNGTYELDLGGADYNDGDYLLIKIAPSIIGQLSPSETGIPVLYLTYKIRRKNLSSIVILDRRLPFFSFLPNNIINYYIFEGGESIDNLFSSPSQAVYWNNETLEFASDCDLSLKDVEVVNMNNVWSESLAGTMLFNENYLQYGSSKYLSTKEYLGYNTDCPEIIPESEDCEDKLLSVYDDYVKGISIIHYTNNNISNEYGEFLHITDNGSVMLDFPTIMYHRRAFGTEDGNVLGMRFVSDNTKYNTASTEIEYYNLIEDPNLVDGEPISVGRIYPTLKIITIHDEELLAAISYKSNRNFTLPRLNGSLISPINGIGNGVLKAGKTMYVTYALESNNGLMYSLPQQKYTKFVNKTKIDRDVSFKIEDINQLPYMRHIERAQYDGMGFYAKTFKVLCQIVDNQEDRPLPDKWIAIDFTNNAITNAAGLSIDPLKFERQNSQANGFLLDNVKFSSGIIYDLNVLDIPYMDCPDELNFGDERFHFGVYNAKIGACIYKSKFNINIDSNKFNNTSNKSYSGGQLYATEIGLYNSNKELIAISKLSRPIMLKENTKFSVEISMDF